jgi:hypothetical protein
MTLVEKIEAEYEKAKCGHPYRLSDRPMQAAIDAVFDHLSEPSEGMVTAGAEELVGPTATDAAHCWQAMLHQARKEANDD